MTSTSRVVPMNTNVAGVARPRTLGANQTLDAIIDAFEEEVARRGFEQADIREFGEQVLANEQDGTIDGLVELLRVWLEHGHRAGVRYDVGDCTRLFPRISFNETQHAALQFEVDRLGTKTAEHPSGSEVKDKQASLDRLPPIGSHWGRFHLIDLLGEGSYARVYLAKQTDLADRLVALKLTLRETSESQWLATLQHTAIVPVLFATRIGDVFGICMPYLGNTTLADLVQLGSSGGDYGERTEFAFNGGSMLSNLAHRSQPLRERVRTVCPHLETVPIAQFSVDTLKNQSEVDPSTMAAKRGEDLRVVALPTVLSPQRSPAARQLAQLNRVDTVLWILSQLADGLAHAHRHGILHCDLKPANVLLGVDGQPRLLDFNVSYAHAAAGTADGIGGTPAYMAPEHWHAMHGNGKIDARTDLYSLGCVLYELLTGFPPRPTDDPEAFTEVKPPSQHRPDISPAVDAIVLRCLQRNPIDRYPNADALYEDLQAQLHHRRLVHQREPSTREAFAKWRKRHPVLASTASLLGMGAILVGVLSWLLVTSRASNRRNSALVRANEIERTLLPAMASLTASSLDPTLQSESERWIDQVLALAMPVADTGQDDPTGWMNRLPNLEQRNLHRQLASLVSAMDVHQSRHPVVPESAEFPETRSLAKSRYDSLRRALSLGEATSEIREDFPFANVQARLMEGNYEGARSISREWLKQTPRDYLALFLDGESCFCLRDYGAAERAANLCVALEPEVPQGWYLRAAARYELNRLDEALEDWSEVVRLDPASIGARLNGALVLKRLRRLDEAIVEVDQVLAGGYRTVRTLRLRGELAALQGDAQSASKYHDEAMQTKPGSEIDYVERGILRLSQDPAAAASDFAAALQANPGYGLASMNLAHVQSEHLGDLNSAIRTLDQQVALGGVKTEFLTSRAVLLGRARQWDRLKTELVSLGTLPINDPMAMYQVGCAFSLFGAQATEGADQNRCAEAAIRWIAKALSLHPGLWKIVQTDPDCEWLRQRDEWRTLSLAWARGD